MADGGTDAGVGSLTVLIDSSGAGVITSDPPGIDCGKACYAHYPLGSKVTLTATPDSLSVFGGFIGAACSGLGPCTIEIDGDVGVIAQFATIHDAGVFDAGTADAGSPPASTTDASADASVTGTSTLTVGGGCSSAPYEAHGEWFLVGFVVAVISVSRFRGRAGRSARRRC